MVVPVTVLVVDDEVRLLRVIAEILKEAGYDVLTADCGARALELARQHARIDALLTDLAMPDLSGRELATFFTVIHPHAAIVVMSGADDGRGPILRKPFNPDELLATLATALR